MPSTFSPSLKLELIGNGEQAGVWGTTTNSNLGTLLEQAITGVITIDVTGLSTYTLTNFNGLSAEARNAVLVFTGVLSNTCAVTVPSANKTYVIANKTTGANAVVVKTTTANTTNVSVASQITAIVYSDGTNVYSATTLNNINGSLTITGDLTVGGTNYSNGGISTTSGNLRLNSNTGLIAANASTGAFIFPIGTDAQKPGSPVNGMMRYNTTLGFFEGYIAGQWQKILFSPEGVYTISFVAVAGGGGGSPSPGNVIGGGGGGGGLINSTAVLTPSVTYTITVGAGGGSGVAGTNTLIVGIATAVGGGLGGNTGGSGGSGGGGGNAAGSGTVGQGNNGGSGNGTNGGGGGGAGATGTNAGGAGGAGGAGSLISIAGPSTYYAGGGGGGSSLFSGGGGGGGGGTGGGGAGGGPGVNGTTNTGGGGGGALWNGVDLTGGNGGSGICILSIPTTNYTGTYSGSPVITINGANTILTFNNSGTYTA